MNTRMKDRAQNLIDEGRAALMGAEGCIDGAVANVSATLLKIASEREGLGIAAHLTQGVLEDSAQLIFELVGQRRSALRLHDRIARTAVQVGFPAELIGPTDKPTEGTDPPPAMIAPEVTEPTLAAA